MTVEPKERVPDDLAPSEPARLTAPILAPLRRRALEEALGPFEPDASVWPTDRSGASEPFSGGRLPKTPVSLLSVDLCGNEREDDWSEAVSVKEF